jgi:signal transduction histidine kinase
LILIVGSILITGFLITIGLGYQVSKNSLRAALIDEELPLTSNNIYSEIQRDLLQPILVSSTMSNDTFVKDWLLGGEHDVAKITRYLDEIRLKYDLFTSFLVSEKSRNYYHFKGLTQVVSDKDPKDSWYFRVRDMAGVYELNVDANEEQNDTRTIFINHKIIGPDNKYLGAIGVGLEFNTVARIVERYKERFGRNIYFVADNGDISVRSAGAAITEPNIHSARGISEISKNIMTAGHAFFEYSRDGENMLLNTRYIPELGWRVIVEQQEAQAFSAIRKGLITSTLIGIGIIVLTMLIVAYTLNLFHFRLEAMLTDAKTAEQKMAELVDQLNFEIDVKNRFFSLISHDLISPFNALLGMTHMMSTRSEKYDKAQLVEFAGDVNESGNRVFDLLQNLLEWSRLQMDGMAHEPEMIDLKDLTQECLDLLRPVAEQKNVTLVNNVGGLQVYADRGMALTVTRNLVSNALKFSEAGGKVEVSSEGTDELVEITVSDDGVGMSQEQIDNAFALDEQTSTAGTAGEMGTGLGLPLCKDMLERNGGTIRIDSSPGEGARFHFVLPATPHQG